MRINKATIQEIKTPEKSATITWDDTVAGFGIRTTPTGAKSFVVQARVKNKSRRLTLAKVGVLTPAQARKRARVEIARMAEGIDPAEEKQKAKMHRAREKVFEVTLRQVFEEYQNSRRKDGKVRKPRTIKDIEYHLNGHFADWVQRPITDITRDGVLKRHRQIAKSSTHQADQAFRYLRALLNFAADMHTAPDGAPILPANPVDVLRSARQWHAPKRRRHVIAAANLGPTIAEIERIALDAGELTAAQTEADLLLFLLFTGLRKGEAATLKWAAVEHGHIRLEDPKNRKDVVTLPMSDEAADVLARRYPDSEFIFPGRSNGHIRDTRGVRDRVAKAAGAPFTNHDLRRTFISVAEAHDIGEYTLKQLLNHAVSSADVTGGYIVPGFERLRQAANRVGTFMRNQAEIATRDNVVEIGVSA